MAKDSSFLPKDYLEKRIAQRTNVICASLFVVVMIAVVTAFSVTNRQRNETKAQQEEINTRFEQAALLLEQLELMQSQKALMIRKAMVTSELIESVPRSLILAELINHMPKSLSLLEFNLETKVVRVKSRARTSMDRARQKQADQLADPMSKPPIPQTKLLADMVGVAPTDREVAQYMTALNQHPMSLDVTLVYSEEKEIDDQKMRQFRITIVINHELNVNELAPTHVARDLQMDPMGQMKQLGGTVPAGGSPKNITPVLQRRSN
jgi:hypothetical protein